MSVMLATSEPEKGHWAVASGWDASAEVQAKPTPAFQPLRSLSNPGFWSKFAALGWGQLHGVPLAQQRPLQDPLWHCAAALHNVPSSSLSTQLEFLQYVVDEQCAFCVQFVLQLRL